MLFTLLGAHYKLVEFKLHFSAELSVKTSLSMMVLLLLFKFNNNFKSYSFE
jgi:hypothetical protein